jgi:hypothetical protein
VTWWTWRHPRATVIERLEGRLLDVSASGCRLEAASMLEVGSVGVIEISGLSTPIAEAARVCRVTHRPGASARYVLHLEFLPLPLPRRAPARVAVCNGANLAEDQVLTACGERSDSGPTTAAVPRRATTAQNTGITRVTPETAIAAGIATAAEPLATELDSRAPVNRGRIGHGHRCHREPSAFSGTTWIRADDL